jgi:hypothetical protein
MCLKEPKLGKIFNVVSCGFKIKSSAEQPKEGQVVLVLTNTLASPSTEKLTVNLLLKSKCRETYQFMMPPPAS